MPRSQGVVLARGSPLEASTSCGPPWTAGSSGTRATGTMLGPGRARGASTPRSNKSRVRSNGINGTSRSMSSSDSHSTNVVPFLLRPLEPVTHPPVRAEFEPLECRRPSRREGRRCPTRTFRTDTRACETSTPTPNSTHSETTTGCSGLARPASIQGPAKMTGWMGPRSTQLRVAPTPPPPTWALMGDPGAPTRSPELRGRPRGNGESGVSWPFQPSRRPLPCPLLTHILRSRPPGTRPEPTLRLPSR